MNTEKHEFSMIRDYLGFDQKRLLIFGGLVVGVMVVTTAIYVAIFGFDTWTTNMKQAGNMMVANFATPNPSGQQAQTFMPARPFVHQIQQQPWATAPCANQFICPNCGASGLPQYNLNGTPVCPHCRALMSATGRNQLHARPLAQP